MPSLCNSTLSSSPDRDECQYWSSFSEKPLCCGDRLQLYKGKLNGKGPRGGDFSVVKVFRDRPGTETRCCKELAKATTASDWLARFLAHGQYRPERVRVAQLQMAPMDQVSLLNKLFAHNKRRPSSGEWILLEEMVEARGTLLQFVDRDGRMFRERAASASGVGVRFSPATSSSPSCCSAPACCLDNRQLLEAFVHYTHHASGGQLVVCGLEGQQDEQGRLVLKTPVIHSLHKAFGDTDLGPHGVQEVMSRHACNRHCRRLAQFSHPGSSSPSLLHKSPPLSPSPLVCYPRVGRSPSAPFDPDVFLESEGSRRSSSMASAPPYDGGDWSVDVSRLSLDVFASPVAGPLDWRLLFQLELSKAAAVTVPDEPPPPYTEFIEDLM